MLLSGGADGILRLVNASDGRTIRVVGRGSAGVRSALFSGDGRRILATVGDGQVTRVWDLMIAERVPEHARAAAAAVDRPTELRFVEKLSLAEWYGLQGRQAWAAKLIAGAVMPKDAGVETRISTARCLWGAGDLAAASEQFTAALGEHPAASDVPYLTLCREAASRGEP
jgi:hypothetical protein